jgi:hypothetical protein
VITHNAIKQGRFASAIGADQTDDFTLIDIEEDVIIGNHSTKVFDKINDLEKCHVYLPLLRNCSTMPQIPRG